MYTVHNMIRVTATEARKRIFDLLDRAARGEAVLIERSGTLLRLSRGPTSKKSSKKAPDYRSHIQGSVSDAHEWSWDWTPSRGLRLKGSQKK